MCAIVFLIIGCLLRFFPPKNISSFYGYRTVMSMKNHDTWDESQKYAGSTMITFGICNLVLFTFRVYAPMILNDDLVQLIFLIIGTIIYIYINESRLRRIFTNEGERK